MEEFYAMKEQEKRNRSEKVAFYAKFLAEHEAQTYALGNRIQWYDELATKHKTTLYKNKYEEIKVKVVY